MQVPTVADLIKKLQEFNPKMGVVFRNCSDVWPLPIELIRTVQAVPPRPGDGRDSLMVVDDEYGRDLESLTDEDKDRITTYVHFPGN